MKKKKIDLEKLKANDPKIKYAFVKELLQRAKQSPQDLYDFYDYWIDLLASNNNILKWTAIDIIGHLSTVDTEEKTTDLIPRLYQFLHDGQLVTCSHAIFALGLIAQNKPGFKHEIIGEFMKVPQDTFKTDDCRSIAVGKVLDNLTPFIRELKDDNRVREFVNMALKDHRNATRKRAEKMIKKLEKA